MKISLWLFAFILFFILSCKKYNTLSEYDDLKGTLAYTGRLLLVNNIDSIGTPNGIGSIPIHISLASSPTIDLFDTVTDKNGYFSFRNLKKSTKYKISVTDYTHHGILYDSVKEISLIDADITDPTAFTIYPNYAKQNGVVFTIRDSATRGYINSCNVYLYTSRQLANSDTAYVGYNSVANLPVGFSLSNAIGRSFLLNIQLLPSSPMSPYIVRFRKDLNANRQLKKDTSFIPAAKGIQPIEILL